MYGGIDFEGYTIAIARLNVAFQKMESVEHLDETRELICKSIEDLERLHEDLQYNLRHNRINFDEYKRFFEYGLMVFPKYIENIETIKNDELENHLKRLIKAFDDLNRLSISFCQIEVVK